MGSEVSPWCQGRVIVAGDAAGTALVLDRGLSFAMGFDVESGRITDVHSPFTGERLSGRVLVMPVGRGSSSASTSFAETLRLGTGPAGIILREVDEIIAIGALVARTLYRTNCPIIVAEAADYEGIQTGGTILIERDGTFRVQSASSATPSASKS